MVLALTVLAVEMTGILVGEAGGQDRRRELMTFTKSSVCNDMRQQGTQKIYKNPQLVKLRTLHTFDKKDRNSLFMKLNVKAENLNKTTSLESKTR